MVAGGRQVFNTKGYTLIEAMIVVAIVGVISAGTISTFEFLLREKARLSAISNLELIRNKISAVIDDADAWSATIADSSDLECLNTNTECDHGVTVSPILRNPVGEAVYDPTTQGFDWNGGICALESGEIACPLHYQIVTKLSCGSVAKCTKPAVVTQAKLVIRSDNLGVRINSSRFDLESYQSRSPASLGGAGDGGIVTADDIAQEVASRGLQARMHGFLQETTSPASSSTLICLYGPSANWSYAWFDSVLTLTASRELRVVSGHRAGQTLCVIDKWGECSVPVRMVYHGIGALYGFCGSTAYPVYTSPASPVRFTLSREGLRAIYTDASNADNIHEKNRLMLWYTP